MFRASRVKTGVSCHCARPYAMRTKQQLPKTIFPKQKVSIANKAMLTFCFRTNKKKEVYMDINEYSQICDNIIRETMKFVDLTTFKRYTQLKSPDTDDFIYNSAVCDSAPLSVIYAPSGAGKSSLIADRTTALLNHGVPAGKILVLNMNVTKTKQMLTQFPSIKCRTFNDFTHDIFSANYPGVQATDTTSVINALLMLDDSKTTPKFINILRAVNPQDRMVMASIFINKNVTDVLNCILSAKKSTHTLESMLCQNLMYALSADPFNVDAILVNGIHNMSVPTLCCVLQYCAKYHCNLFLTGDPDESIYDFSMAYGNAMNLLTAYEHVNIVRLQNRSKMSPSLTSVVNLTPPKTLSDIFVKVIEGNDVQKSIPIAFANNPYITDKIASNEQMMIVARSKQDITDIKNCLKTYYPNIKIVDITTANPEKLCYASIAVKYLPILEQKYTEITGEQLFYEIYNALSAEPADSIAESNAYAANRQNAKTFFETHKDMFGNKPMPAKDAVQKLIDIEADISSDYLAALENNAMVDTSDANIILSTIHASIDIRCDNVIAFIRNKIRFGNMPLYRVALTRANKSEYVIFVNERNGIINDYEKYLTQYAVKL